MEDLAWGVGGAAAVLAGVAIEAIIHATERRSRLRDATFEKRLDAHQHAFNFNQEIYHACNSKDAVKIKEVNGRAKTWWNNNALYIDKKSRISMLAVLNSSSQYAVDIQKTDKDALFIAAEKRVWNDLKENLDDITAGIGTDHLPQRKFDCLGDNEQKAKKGFIEKLKEKIEQSKNLSGNKRFRQLTQLTFVLSIAVVLGLIFAAAALDSKISESDLGYFVCQGIATALALIAAFYSSRDKRIVLTLTIAIDFFVAGMIFQLLSLITVK